MIPRFALGHVQQRIDWERITGDPAPLRFSEDDPLPVVQGCRACGAELSGYADYCSAACACDGIEPVMQDTASSARSTGDDVRHPKLARLWETQRLVYADAQRREQELAALRDAEPFHNDFEETTLGEWNDELDDAAKR